MNILKILEEIEKLITEIILWIVYIPKTLLKIVQNPSWVPKYIDQELKSDSRKFKDFVSPLILVLVNSLVLYYLLQQVIRSDLIQINIYFISLVNEIFSLPQSFNDDAPFIEQLQDTKPFFLRFSFWYFLLYMR